jgi:hypothetical protein
MGMMMEWSGKRKSALTVCCFQTWKATYLERALTKGAACFRQRPQNGLFSQRLRGNTTVAERFATTTHGIQVAYKRSSEYNRSMHNHFLAEADKSNRKEASARLLSATKPFSRLQWREAIRTLEWWTNENGGSELSICIFAKLCEQESKGENELDETLAKKVAQSWARDFVAGVSTLSVAEFSRQLKICQEAIPSLRMDVSAIIHSANAKRQTQERSQGEKLAIPNISLLEEMESKIEKSQIQDDPSVCPDVRTINAAISASLSFDEPELAERVLTRMWNIYDCRQWQKIRPNHITYHNIMVSWVKTCRSTERAVRVERLLQQLKKRHSEHHYDKGLTPQRQHYILALSAYSRDGDLKRAQALFDYMLKSFTLTREISLKPTGKVCAVYLSALSRKPDVTAPVLAAAVVHNLFERFHDNMDPDWLPTPQMYTSYMKIWIDSGRPDGAQQAQKILDDMSTKPGNLSPNIMHYGAVISGWCKADEPDRAESIVRFLCEKTKVKPDIKCFLEVVKAWSSRNTSEANKRAEKLLVLMKEIEGTSGTERSTATLDIMRILSRSIKGGDAQRSEDIIHRMQSQYYLGHSSLKATTEHYNAALGAWSRSNEFESPDRAEALLLEMLERFDHGDNDLSPTEQSFTSVITCWGRSNREEAGLRAQAVFDGMQDRRDQQHLSSLCVTAASYSALIMAWARAGEPNRAEIVLQEMHNDYLNGNKAAEPNQIVFNATINAWGKSQRKGREKRVDQIIRLMQQLGDLTEVRPDIVTFSTAIASCMRSELSNAHELAESYLDEAKRLYAEGDSGCKPNSMCYGAVIQAIVRGGKSDAPLRAEKYLNEMISQSELDAKQVQMAFAATISSWAHASYQSENVLKAEALLDTMTAFGSKRGQQFLPGLRVYTEVLIAISKSEPRIRAKKATALSQSMQANSIFPDEICERIFNACFIRKRRR